VTSYSVSFDSDAEIKIEKAASWYNYQSPGLGDKFRDQVYSQIDTLEENPRRHAIRYRNVHCVPLQNQPCFTIHYSVNEEEKTVLIEDFTDNRRGPNHPPRQT
jgi:mRNA-degrading endonuclease RelE of RelBE toxin-antitoxin system